MASKKDIEDDEDEEYQAEVQKQIESQVLVSAVRDWAKAHMTIGGDLVSKQLTDEEIVSLGSLSEVVKWVESLLERALNARFGLDDDPALLRWQEFQEWLAYYQPALVDDAELDW